MSSDTQERLQQQKKLFCEKMLTLLRFLRAAAARRQLEDDNLFLIDGTLYSMYTSAFSR
jgi:hypothetical protein